MGNDEQLTPGVTETDTSHSTDSPPIHLNRSICDFNDFEYHADWNAYRASYDTALVEPTTAIVSAVAAVTDTDANTMPSLYSSIDPDALNSLMDNTVEDRDARHTIFSYNNFQVTISSYGNITLRDAEPDILTPQEHW